MPDLNGQWTIAELKVAVDKLGPMFVGKNCPMCNSDKLQLEPYALRIGAMEQGPLSERVYPLLAIVCTNCGYNMLFNAIMLGVLQRDQMGAKPEESKAAEHG